MNKQFDFDDTRTIPTTGKPSGSNAFYTTFQCDKPYRLAFYVQPNLKRRRMVVNRNVNNTTSNVDSTKTSNITCLSTTQNKTVNKTEEVIKPATKKGNGRKRGINKENEGKNTSKNNKKDETKSVLFETENTSATQTRSSGRLRELNFKKLENTPPEKEPEPSKDETMEVKKKRYSATYGKKQTKPKEPTRTKPKEPARTKQKDTTKQNIAKKAKADPDFEKWAQDLNKEFDEVENFNISVSYD